jgi:mRNA interferase HigB
VRVSVIKWVNVLRRVEKDQRMLNAFLHFYKKLKYVEWEKPQDIRRTFNTTEVVTCDGGSSRLVFNVGGNKYRMVCGYKFSADRIFLFVKFVGTHEEYNKVDVCTVEMFKS